ARRWYSSDARVNQPVRPGEWVIAIAATISATTGLQAFLQRHGLRGLPRKRPAVALQRGAGVAVVGGAEEQTQDLRHVVLVHPEVHQPAGILVADRLVLLLAEPELARQAFQVGEPARPQRRVPADVVHHRVRRQRLVAALDVTHSAPTPRWP